MLRRGLVKDVEGLKWAVMFLLVLIFALVAAMLMGRVSDEERVERWVKAGGWTNEYGTPVPSPTAEVAGVSLAVATINDYASMEAERIAKMAAVVMDMGGEYVTKCEATYDSVTETTAVGYSITWSKGDSRDKGSVEKTWYGLSWGSCIAKMSKWKAGK